MKTWSPAECSPRKTCKTRGIDDTYLLTYFWKSVYGLFWSILGTGIFGNWYWAGEFSSFWAGIPSGPVSTWSIAICVTYG